ncbi:hypothetical protein [Mycobacterium sp. HUMS_1102779]|uniref:hypothetical protein n=1 Tax=Mycobacterium sp. HUMS_1102779 TaxID=3383487 RepID=UPI00389A1CCA
MPDEPPLRRSVLDFCKHYGLNRNQYFTARSKAKVRAKDWGTLLSANDEKALLRYISAAKQNDQMMRRIREQPTVTKQFVHPPKSPIDYEAEISRISDKLAKWRKVLVEFAKGHVADPNGRCKRCHEEAPCQTKRTMNRLDNELVEHVAVADSGDAADQPVPEVAPERTLRQLRDACNRCMRALTDLTIDHMLEDRRGRCTQCRVSAPCDIKKAVTRINRGIAHQIEKFASMDDEELEVALGDADGWTTTRTRTIGKRCDGQLGATGRRIGAQRL